MTKIERYDLPVYSISAAARLLDISVHTVRMYEREGLIIPFKEDHKNRLYSDRDIDRIRCIRDAIKEKKYSISSIRAMISLMPCWEIMECTTEEQENCLAYRESGQPCWTYDHQEDPCKERNCRECKVYRHIKCDEIKESIRNISR